MITELEHLTETGLEAGLIGLLVILAGMIKIPHLEINFWGWLGRMVGRAINGEVMDKVDKLSSDLDDFKEDVKLEDARRARQRILRFSDEILFNKRHSKEHFDEILEDINLYKKYCREHPDFVNNRADLSIATIQEVYTDCLQTHDFLIHEKKKKS